MSYTEGLTDTVDWMVRTLGDKDWKTVFPVFLRANGLEAFDYAAEDAWVSSHG